METAFVKLFFAYLFFISAPVILAVLRVYLVGYAKLKNKEKAKKMKEQEQIEKKQRNKIILEEYNSIVKPFYEEGRNLFNSLVKSKKLKRQNINDLKDMLNSSIGSYGEKYEKYKFKNDAHEIYVKMKSTKIDKYDWVRIIEYLRKCA